MKSLLLLSGGVDSALLLQRYHASIGLCVFFEYGQPSEWRERVASGELASVFGLRRQVRRLPLSAPNMGKGCDPSVVPVRNLAMMAVGASVAAANGLERVLIGSIADDAAEYVDCRLEYVRAAAALCEPFGVTIEAPLVDVSKADVIVELMENLRALSWSCYRRGKTQCGSCASCVAAGVMP